MGVENGIATSLQPDELDHLRTTPACAAVVDWLCSSEDRSPAAGMVWAYLRECIAYPAARKAARLTQTDARELRAYFLGEMCRRVFVKLEKESAGVVDAKSTWRPNKALAAPKTIHVLEKSAVRLRITLKHKNLTASASAVWSLDENQKPVRRIAILDEALADGVTTMEVEIGQLGENHTALVQMSCGSMEPSAAFRAVSHFTYESRLAYLGGVVFKLVQEDRRAYGPRGQDGIHRVGQDDDDEPELQDPRPTPLAALIKRGETRQDALQNFKREPGQYTPEARAQFPFNPVEWPAIWTDFEIEILNRKNALPEEVRRVIENSCFKRAVREVPSRILELIRIKGSDALLLLLTYYSNVDQALLLQRFPAIKNVDDLEETVQRAVKNLPKRPAVTQPGYGYPGTILWRDYDGLSHHEIAKRLPLKKNGGAVESGHARVLYVRAVSACEWLAGEREDPWPAAHSC